MYGIPPTTDLSFLRHKTLTQVGFGPYDLQLEFLEQRTHISITSTIGYALADGTYAERSVGPEEGVVSVLDDPFPLFQLLMKKVTDIGWTAEGTITLEFEGAARLQIYNDNGPYESYTITHDGALFVI